MTNENKPRKVEAILENTILVNALRYIFDELKKGKTTHLYTLEDGALRSLSLQVKHSEQ